MATRRRITSPLPRKAKTAVMWTAIALYVISPIDLDPGLPFTDAGAVALGLWRTAKVRK